jgi:hypothetical protein
LKYVSILLGRWLLYQLDSNGYTIRVYTDKTVISTIRHKFASSYILLLKGSKDSLHFLTSNSR